MGIDTPRSEFRDKPLIKAVKMHILVHPGYIKDTKVRLDKQQIAQSEILPGKYAEVARNLPANEIMVILIHNKPEKFRSDFNTHKPYVENIQVLRSGLPDLQQAIILTSETVPFSGADKDYDQEALSKIRSIAENRGYEVGAGTAVDIFGETYDECVQEALLGINNADFFNKDNVKIIKDLTDMAAT